MLTFVNDVWGARCGKTARRVLLGETRTRSHAYSVRRRRESACDRKAPHRLKSSRLVSTNLLDLWAHQWRKRHARGDVIIVRWADDFVIGFQYEDDARRFKKALHDRFQRFALELHPEKTRLIRFGRFAHRDCQRFDGRRKPETFNFLGLTHTCGVNRGGRFLVRRTTMRKRLTAKLHEVKA